MSSGCSLSHLVGLVLSDTLRPRPPAEVTPGWAEPVLLLAGDLHFHMGSPAPELFVPGADGPRSFDQGVELLRHSGLDFVAITPHLMVNWVGKPASRQHTFKYFASVFGRLAELAGTPRALPLVVIPGAEFTDGRGGHAGVLFADVAAALGEPAVQQNPQLDSELLRRLVKQGALVVANHPLVTPLHVWLAPSFARADLSWQPFTRPAIRAKLRNGVRFLDSVLHGIEVYNIPASRARDEILLGDPLVTTRGALRLLDREILRRRRRLFPAGGSDSHDMFTRATLFVGARARTLAAIRQGLLSGRVCTRAPDPCALTARADDQPQRYGVGDAVTVRAELTLTWPGRGELFLDGRPIGEFIDKVTFRLPQDGCHLFRLQLAGGFSGPLYVNCPFAALPAQAAK